MKYLIIRDHPAFAKHYLRIKIIESKGWFEQMSIGIYKTLFLISSHRSFHIYIYNCYGFRPDYCGPSLSDTVDFQNEGEFLCCVHICPAKPHCLNVLSQLGFVTKLP